MLVDLGIKVQKIMDGMKSFDAVAALALRMYLAPVFFVAGMNKVNSFDDIVSWFGNADWGLGLPFPTLLAYLATGAEVVGAVLIFFGLATRFTTIPLIITMIVAIMTVHWHNGWQAVHDLQSPWANASAEVAVEKLDAAKSLLQEHGNYDWLTETGSFIVSNNGIEWGVTYLIMLLALLAIGGGKYVSLDYYIRKQFMPNK